MWETCEGVVREVVEYNTPSGCLFLSFAPLKIQFFRLIDTSSHAKPQSRHLCPLHPIVMALSALEMFSTCTFDTNSRQENNIQSVEGEVEDCAISTGDNVLSASVLW